jgi:hypothetical protein
MSDLLLLVPILAPAQQQHGNDHQQNHRTSHCWPPHRKDFSHGVSVTRTCWPRKMLRHVKSVQCALAKSGVAA